ncbi:MAG: alanine dehydrogenase [Candidatus Rokubacteria bacterium]|nr:alanine dehydrogenase [Chloroflexota bacterium]MBM4441483.1 alanine dehydrogenase [Candidatus Rokubacteria bacterium]
MIVGTVKETKTEEYRVALTPEGVADIVRAGHHVLIETRAGEGSNYGDDEYREAGAEVLRTPGEVYARAELMCEVKEPQPQEFALLREGQVLFTYLHLAAAPDVADALIAARCTAIGYETVQREDGFLPLLAPMSEVAGRMAVEIGAHFLKRPGPGRGMLLGGLPGVPPAHVVIIGSGNVGKNACRAAVGFGARVTVISIDENQLRALEELYAGRVETRLASPQAIAETVTRADLLIGAVLVDGRRAPVVVTREMVRSMGAGAVIVDVAVDQGGCIETTRPTDHVHPIYVEEGVVHYAVPNMPGAVPRTSSRALTGLTLPYILKVANKGVEAAIRSDPALARGVNVYRGVLTHPDVAESLGRAYRPLNKLLGVPA